MQITIGKQPPDQLALLSFEARFWVQLGAGERHELPRSVNLLTLGLMLRDSDDKTRNRYLQSAA